MRGRLAPRAWCAAALAVACSVPARLDAAGKPSAAQSKVAAHRIVTRRFVLEFSVEPSLGSTYAELCEKAYRRFCRIFHVSEAKPVWEGKCRVFLFAERAQFVRFAARVHRSPRGMRSGGYTRIRKANPEIALFLHRNDHIRLQQTLVHEMTHVFLQLFHKPARIATWLHEGCAQFFEFQHYPKHSRLADSRKLAKTLVQTNKYHPFARFWNSDFPPTDQASYAQAWSLVDFMVNGGPGASKKASKFILLLKEGRSQEEALQAAFKLDLARLEAGWKAYVLKNY